MTEDDDYLLIQRFLAGDKAAEKAVHLRLDPPARKLASFVFARMRFAQSSRALEAVDLYGGAILHILEHRRRIFARFERGRRLEPFAYRVMQRRMWDLASGEPRLAHVDIDDVELPVPAHEAQVLRGVDVDTVVSLARESLTENGRGILDLMFRERLDDDEIASRCAMTKGNVQLWRWRILRVVESTSMSLGLRSPTVDA